MTSATGGKEAIIAQVTAQALATATAAVDKAEQNGATVAPATKARYVPPSQRKKAGEGALVLTETQRAAAQQNTAATKQRAAELTAERDTKYAPHRATFEAARAKTIDYADSANRHASELGTFDPDAYIKTVDINDVDFGTGDGAGILFHINLGDKRGTIVGSLGPTLRVFHVGASGGGKFNPL